MISFFVYSSLNDEKTQCDRFEPRINPQDSKNGYGYYQLWITANMSVCLSLSDTDCRKLMDVLGSRPPLPTENDAPVRNAAVAEPMRSILDAISPHCPSIIEGGGRSEDAPF